VLALAFVVPNDRLLLDHQENVNWSPAGSVPVNV